MKQEQVKKLLNFTIKENNVIKALKLPQEIFLPLLFSVRYGGDWSLKKNSKKLMSVKEKLTNYDENEKIGYTLELIYLFVNPMLISEEGKVYRMEKCGNNNERELVERPYKLTINGEYILKATLDPKKMKIFLKHLRGPISFIGSGAYGASHEIEHLNHDEIKSIPFYDFEYIIEE
ncbi:MAG: RimK/LysX family protein [Methanobrevibacter sp.]|nr:RimK/LysX family protein [Candidatus Methanovirga basalitermitum]